MQQKTFLTALVALMLASVPAWAVNTTAGADASGIHFNLSNGAAGSATLNLGYDSSLTVPTAVNSGSVNVAGGISSTNGPISVGSTTLYSNGSANFGSGNAMIDASGNIATDGYVSAAYFGIPNVAIIDSAMLHTLANFSSTVSGCGSTGLAVTVSGSSSGVTSFGCSAISDLFAGSTYMGSASIPTTCTYGMNASVQNGQIQFTCITTPPIETPASGCSNGDALVYNAQSGWSCSAPSTAATSLAASGCAAGDVVVTTDTSGDLGCEAPSTAGLISTTGLFLCPFYPIPVALSTSCTTSTCVGQITSSSQCSFYTESSQNCHGSGGVTLVNCSPL